MPTHPAYGRIVIPPPGHFYMNDIMHCLNSNARKVTSYKYVFFKCILDNLFNAYDYEEMIALPYEYLSESFSRIYWNLSAKYDIPQIINNGKNNFMVVKADKLTIDPLVKGVDFDVLDINIRNKYLQATRNQITKDVMYALYDDFNNTIYGYDNNKRVIFFTPESYKFLCDYKDALEKINFYAWIRWTENILDIRHEKIVNLSSKLDEEPERIALNKFRDELLSKGEPRVCFYCGKPLSRIEVDHFVPWSFIKDNQDWNFVLACHDCNAHKKDKLAPEQFLGKIVIRNRKLFVPNHEQNLVLSYKSALRNGFALWTI